jgi:hypothetical protein
MREDIGRVYVGFALDNPALFSLMFQENRLDSSRPSLMEAYAEGFDILAQVYAMVVISPPSTRKTAPLVAEARGLAR